MRDRVLDLLPVVRVNAVALVDSFDMIDSNLCSSLGSYDGHAYERLFDFARNSPLNHCEVHQIYDKYLKPYSYRCRIKARI